ncbi:hypothetical protein RSOLAG1IB_07194 [Rhizoctonia solani AG-1 IB]|uniref:Uncharacterized protein n=1 Tax=Thanatephorus cucumeris (strain AG1-IB / isolate 7/3/14) TaxID=1108050 RepID=A0A0B7FAR1_THACB|nr:hypothetical protein RSOLAG1IB_07194 [Rhizoctonia solani AG-1 IB]
MPSTLLSIAVLNTQVVFREVCDNRAQKGRMTNMAPWSFTQSKWCNVGDESATGRNFHVNHVLSDYF